MYIQLIFFMTFNILIEVFYIIGQKIMPKLKLYNYISYN